MPSHSELRAISSVLRRRADRQVRAEVQDLAQHLASAVRQGDTQPLAGIMSAPDVEQHMQDTATAAHGKAEAAVRRAWERAGGPPGSGYLDALLSDLGRTYSRAPGEALATANRAFRSVGRSHGVRRPAEESARLRSDEVRTAVQRLGANLAVRSGMSVSSAATRAAGEAELANWLTVPGARKQWQASFVGSTPCPTCQWLHGRAVPIQSSFPQYSPPGVRAAPVWQDLFSPPRHPYCHCRLVIIPPGVPEDVASSPKVDPQRPVKFSDIRDMPERQYHALVSLVRRSAEKVAETVARVRERIGQ